MGCRKYEPTTHKGRVFQESQHIVKSDSSAGWAVFRVEVAKDKDYSKNYVVKKLPTSEKKNIFGQILCTKVFSYGCCTLEWIFV